MKNKETVKISPSQVNWKVFKTSWEEEGEIDTLTMDRQISIALSRVLG